MKKKPVVIFDFGGVLLDWNPRHLFRRLFNGDSVAMENFMREIDFSSWNLMFDEGRAYADGVAELSARFPQHASLIKAYDERWEETISGPIQPVVDLLQPLKDNGYSIHGLSNWSAEKFPIVRDKYGFFELFESYIISGDVRLIKPNPRMFKLMLDRIGHPAADCIFIDDVPANINAASQMGFNTILCESPENIKLELEHLGINF